VPGRSLNTTRTRAAVVLALALAAPTPLAPAPASAKQVPGAGWTTWGNSPVRQSRANTSSLGIANASKLKLAWSRPIGGTGAAQPLYLTRIAVDGKRRDIYVTAAESGRVSAFDAKTGKLLWTRELGAIDTGCAQMPKGVFGVTGTPVYDPVDGAIYVAATDKLWSLDVHSGQPRPGWPILLPIDQFHEHVWGAIALANDHVYLGLASYCDRRPYSGRALSVLTKSATVDHQWVVVNTVGGDPGGGGIWGWGGLAVTADGHVWAASANANTAEGDLENLDHAESVTELNPSLGLLSTSRAPGMPTKGDFGFGSTPIVFKAGACGTLVAAEGKDGALYLWSRPKLAAGPVQRLELAFPATLYGSPAWDPLTRQLFVTTSQGYAGTPGGLDALKVTKDCKLRVAWNRKLGGQLNAVPTVVNGTVVVATGTGQLRVYATKTGKLLARREIGGAVFEAPIAVGGDVAVVTWSRKLVVYRLPAGKAKP
jgi:outer membrane protein assembly factor BamB